MDGKSFKEHLKNVGFTVSLAKSEIVWEVEDKGHSHNLTERNQSG